MKRFPQLDELKKILSYDPETGLFSRLDTGKISGLPIRPGDNLYIKVGVLGRSYSAHRLAWYLYYGIPPREGYEIDHINGKKADNRIENLRELNQAQNAKSAASGFSLRFFKDGQVI